jgi:hypothetical protein
VKNQNEFLPISNSRGQFSLHTSTLWSTPKQQQISAIYRNF